MFDWIKEKLNKAKKSYLQAGDKFQKTKVGKVVKSVLGDPAGEWQENNRQRQIKDQIDQEAKIYRKNTPVLKRLFGNEGKQYVQRRKELKNQYAQAGGEQYASWKKKKDEELVGLAIGSTSSLSKSGLNKLAKTERLPVSKVRDILKKPKRTISWAQSEKQASKLKSALKITEGQLSSDIERQRTQVMQRIETLFKAKKEGTLTPESEKAAKTQIKSILGQLRPKQSEVARATRIQAKKVNSNLKIKDAKKFAKQIGDQELHDFLEYAERNKLRDPDIIDKIIEFRTAGLLSGGRTVMRNLIGNTTATALKTPEKLVAGGLDAVLSKLQGKGRSVYAGEALHDLKGMFSKNKAGRNFIEAIKNEDFSSFARQEELPRFKAIGGKLGKVVRFPFRLSNAPDELFRTANIAGETRAMAYRAGKQQGLKGQQLKEFIKNFKPKATIRKEITDKALERTFQNKSKLAAKVQGLTGEGPGRLLRVPLTFVKTPINISKFITKRTPLGFLRPSLYAGEKLSRAQKIEELGKTITGTAAMAGLYKAADKGYLEGAAPSKKGEREAFYRQGKQDYAFKIGGKYYSLKNLDPISTNIGIAADIAKWRQTKDPREARKIVSNIASHITDQSYMTGLQQILEVLTDEEKRNFNYVLSQQAGSFAPTVLSDVSNVIDPRYRKPDTRSALGALKEGFITRIPFFSKSVKPSRDLFGREVENKGGILSKMLSPTRQTQETKDPVELELSAVGSAPAIPSKTINGYQMGAEEYDHYQQLTGTILYSKLQKLIQHPDYRELDRQDKADMIDDFVKKSRLAARARMVDEMTAEMTGDQLKGELSRLKKEGFLSKDVFEYFLKIRSQGNPQ